MTLDAHRAPASPQVLDVLSRALEPTPLRVLPSPSPRERLVGLSAELGAVLELVKRVAPTKATVLVLGESGTGKELICQAIHRASRRADRPFVSVNCGALTETLLESELFGHERGSFTGAVGRREGRFELADGGTLFLDEIGEVSPALQVKLLRVLQERDFERVGGTQTVKVDVRVVAATNRDLAAEVKAGRFREDLFYRLNVVALEVPALRQRKSDIPMLVAHFVERYGREHGRAIGGPSTEAMNALLAHDWPGNVRELGNVIERAVVLAAGPTLTIGDFPPGLGGRQSERTQTGLIAGASMYEIEKDAILKTLALFGGSTTRAARLLGISIRTIQYRLRAYAQEGGAGHR